MGACCSTSVASSTLPSELTILVVGLDNSGKTTLVQAIGGNYDTDSIVPTVGFAAPVRRRLFGKNLVFYDLGGGSRIRGVWPQYYAEVHGLVYVVDASDPKRLAESAEELHQAVLHPMVVGKPLLVLANKNDLPGCVPEPSLTSQMRLDQLTLCRHTVVPITARGGNKGGKKGKQAALDNSVMLGLQWLVEAISLQLPALEARRVSDQAEHKAAEAKRRQERLACLQARAAAKDAAAAPATSASTEPAASSSGSSGPSAAGTGGKPAGNEAQDAPVPVCKLCRTAPAVRRCAAAGWEAVCDPCGTKAEAEKAAKAGGAVAESNASTGTSTPTRHTATAVSASTGAARGPASVGAASLLGSSETPAPKAHPSPAPGPTPGVGGVQLVMEATPAHGEGSLRDRTAAGDEAGAKPTLLNFGEDGEETTVQTLPTSPDLPTSVVTHSVMAAYGRAERAGVGSSSEKQGRHAGQEALNSDSSNALVRHSPAPPSNKRDSTGAKAQSVVGQEGEHLPGAVEE